MAAKRPGDFTVPVGAMRAAQRLRSTSVAKSVRMPMWGYPHGGEIGMGGLTSIPQVPGNSIDTPWSWGQQTQFPQTLDAGLGPGYIGAAINDESEYTVTATVRPAIRTKDGQFNQGTLVFIDRLKQQEFRHDVTEVHYLHDVYALNHRMHMASVNFAAKMAAAGDGEAVAKVWKDAKETPFLVRNAADFAYKFHFIGALAGTDASSAPRRSWAGVRTCILEAVRAEVDNLWPGMERGDWAGFELRWEKMVFNGEDMALVDGLDGVQRQYGTPIDVALRATLPFLMYYPQLVPWSSPASKFPRKEEDKSLAAFLRVGLCTDVLSRRRETKGMLRLRKRTMPQKVEMALLPHMPQFGWRTGGWMRVPLLAEDYLTKWSDSLSDGAKAVFSDTLLQSAEVGSKDIDIFYELGGVVATEKLVAAQQAVVATARAADAAAEAARVARAAQAPLTAGATEEEKATAAAAEARVTAAEAREATAGLANTAAQQRLTAAAAAEARLAAARVRGQASRRAASRRSGGGDTGSGTAAGPGPGQEADLRGVKRTAQEALDEAVEAVNTALATFETQKGAAGRLLESALAVPGAGEGGGAAGAAAKEAKENIERDIETAGELRTDIETARPGQVSAAVTVRDVQGIVEAVQAKVAAMQEKMRAAVTELQRVRELLPAAAAPVAGGGAAAGGGTPASAAASAGTQAMAPAQQKYAKLEGLLSAAEAAGDAARVAHITSIKNTLDAKLAELVQATEQAGGQEGVAATLRSSAAAACTAALEAAEAPTPEAAGGDTRSRRRGRRARQ